MTLAEIDAKLKKVHASQGGLQSKYARQLIQKKHAQVSLDTLIPVLQRFIPIHASQAPFDIHGGRPAEDVTPVIMNAYIDRCDLHSTSTLVI